MEWDCHETIHRWGSFRMLRDRVGRRQGQEVANLLQSFIGPLEGWLDQQIDRRLVRTFFLALAAIVRLRHSRSGLLLSELGAHMFNVNYFCRLASIILAGSPPYPAPAAGPLRSGSWGRRIPGSPSGGPPGRWPLPWPWGWRRCAPTGRRPGSM